MPPFPALRRLTTHFVTSEGYAPGEKRSSAPSLRTNLAPTVGDVPTGVSISNPFLLLTAKRGKRGGAEVFEIAQRGRRKPRG